ncbi:MAG TPA: tRNA pseudouridine(55) synthase TruB [Vicinamibacterales bacterium]|nr:tRNA pseudouridine(55) synthase TruB [Vicinamibacterales bacterium]
MNGVLVVDKPEGPTSHDVVTLTRRMLGVSRIGHTGTLDPLATGVLPLVIGRATRLAQFLTASDKSYEATIAFGRSTDTYDSKGRETSACDRRPTRAQLDAALEKFRGEFEQTPPAYSAKNIDGERSYELARKAARSAVARPVRRSPEGEGGSTKVETRPKPVIVAARTLEVLGFDGDTAMLSMTVTAGFYVRSLAHDLGEALACGAVLVALRRTRSGEFGLDSAVPLAELLQSKREDLAHRLIPMSRLLADLPAVTLKGSDTLARLRNGVEMGPNDLMAPAAPDAPIVRLLTPDGDLAGLARPAKTAGFLHGWVVFG